MTRPRRPRSASSDPAPPGHARRTAPTSETAPTAREAVQRRQPRDRQRTHNEQSGGNGEPSHEPTQPVKIPPEDTPSTWRPCRGWRLAWRDSGSPRSGRTVVRGSGHPHAMRSTLTPLEPRRRTRGFDHLPTMEFAKLVIAKLGVPPTEVVIGALASIGRAPGNTIVLDEPHVSRHHTVVRVNESGTYLISDLGSSNGTYLNARRVLLPERLRPSRRHQDRRRHAHLRACRERAPTGSIRRRRRLHHDGRGAEP